MSQSALEADIRPAPSAGKLLGSHDTIYFGLIGQSGLQFCQRWYELTAHDKSIDNSKVLWRM